MIGESGMVKLLLLSLMAAHQEPIVVESVCSLTYYPPPERTVVIVQCDTLFSNGFE
jgi:hypothetical protein